MADDTEPTPEVVARIAANCERNDRQKQAAVSKALGPLPDWIPPPTIDRARRLVAKLLHDGFTDDQIALMVEAEPDEKLIVPGIVLDAYAFMLAINELAHIRYAVSLGPEQGLKLLAGKTAVQGHKSATAHQQRDDYHDKQDFQKLFEKHKVQITSVAQLDSFPELAAYKRKYKLETLRDWISEKAPGQLKSGRPTKK